MRLSVFFCNFDLCCGGDTNVIAISSNRAKQAATRQSHAATFAKVRNGRKPPIRRLWERNGRFYAQITVEKAISGDKKVRRFR